MIETAPPPVPQTTRDYLQALQEAYRQGATTAATILPQSPEDYARALHQAFCRGAAAAALPQQSTTAMLPTTTETTQTDKAAPPDDWLDPLEVIDPHLMDCYSQNSDPTETTTFVTNGSPAVGRSWSMPELAPLDNSLMPLEESKRQKRLARNRASARHRRLRKKALVEQYEHQARALKEQLELLPDDASWWGTKYSHNMAKKKKKAPEKSPQDSRCSSSNNDNNHKQNNDKNATEMDQLLAVLAMERGRDETVPQESQVAQLLQQQLQHLEQLEHVATEQDALLQLTKHKSNNNDNSNNDDFAELRAWLDLTPDQCQALQRQSALEAELRALVTVQTAVQQLADNPTWLYQGPSAAAQPLADILHAQAQNQAQNQQNHGSHGHYHSQWAKYTIWTDTAPLEELEIRAPSSSSSTVFAFGSEPQRLAPPTNK